jgi:hypothetical protein
MQHNFSREADNSLVDQYISTVIAFYPEPAESTQVHYIFNVHFNNIAMSEKVL